MAGSKDESYVGTGADDIGVDTGACVRAGAWGCAAIAGAGTGAGGGGGSDNDNGGSGGNGTGRPETSRSSRCAAEAALSAAMAGCADRPFDRWPFGRLTLSVGSGAVCYECVSLPPAGR